MEITQSAAAQPSLGISTAGRSLKTLTPVPTPDQDLTALEEGLSVLVLKKAPQVMLK